MEQNGVKQKIKGDNNINWFKGKIKNNQTFKIKIKKNLKSK
jgi:hypothetical protein